ncbi:MAG: glucose 1-dehydrogenase [Dehalococcoidia bacterium]|nr:glucose 1-dehydrogenase [Dehalococcoidia bacterium]
MALVTGASRGIGRAIAVALAEAGADVVLCARTQNDLEDVARQIGDLGRKAAVVTADLCTTGNVQRMVSQAVSAFGRIDILVNNAGVNPIFKKIEQVSEADWDHVLDIDLKGVFFCCQAVGAHMAECKKGAIINVCSVAGIRGVPRTAPYAAAKAGLLALTRCCAVEWGQYNIRSNAVIPGWVATKLTEGLHQHPKFGKTLVERGPMPRWADADEITGAVVYLASPAASFVTGAEIVIDGGMTIVA